METSPVVRFVSQSKEHGDCCVAALAMLLGKSYEEALVAAVRIEKNVLKAGMNWLQVRRAAKLLGATLIEKRKSTIEDEDEDTGILNVTLADGTPHAVLLSHGLIFDGRTNAAWEPPVYLAVHQGTPTTILVRTK